MASVVQKRKKWCVVYNYINEQGEKKQKWETWGTKKEAEKRKREIEYQQDKKTFVPPTVKTLSDFLYEFVNLYGINHWGFSTYEARRGLIDNYINPLIGDWKLSDITPRMMDEYYNKTLPATKAVIRHQHKDKGEFVSARNVREIHKILSCAFQQAVKWEYVAKNPVINATLPKAEKKPRDIWTIDSFQAACNHCENDRLLLCLHLAFACSMRIGEILALTWDNVDVTEESIAQNNAYVYIDKTLMRVKKSVINQLGKNDILFAFPPQRAMANSLVLLTPPKTDSSVRKVWLPKTIALLLKKAKQEQDEWKELLDKEYQDYNLVITLQDGRPVEERVATQWFYHLIQKADLPRVVFHSLRHTSTTYKLKLYGDIKAVQGDTGHAQATMVTEQYAHIMDEDRRHNAQVFEQAFYHTENTPDTKEVESQPAADVPAPDVQALIEQLQNSPELASQIMQALSQLPPKGTAETDEKTV